MRVGTPERRSAARSARAQSTLARARARGALDPLAQLRGRARHAALPGLVERERLLGVGIHLEVELAADPAELHGLVHDTHACTRRDARVELRDVVRDRAGCSRGSSGGRRRAGRSCRGSGRWASRDRARARRAGCRARASPRAAGSGPRGARTRRAPRSASRAWPSRPSSPSGVAKPSFAMPIG